VKIPLDTHNLDFSLYMLIFPPAYTSLPFFLHSHLSCSSRENRGSMQGWADGVGGGGVHGRGGVDEEVEEGEAAVARQARSREIDLDEYEKSVYRFGRKVAEGEVGAGRGGEGVTHTRGGGGLEVEGRGEGPRKGPLTRGELEQEIKILRR